MYRFHRERGEADGDIFRAALIRCRIANPFAGLGDDSLSRDNIEGAGLAIRISVFDAQRALQHNGELVEVGSLAGFSPSRRAAHVGDAGSGSLCVDASDILVDQLRFVARGLDARCLGNEYGHDSEVLNTHGSGYRREALSSLPPTIIIFERGVMDMDGVILESTGCPG
jgi:hypothetical protein